MTMCGNALDSRLSPYEQQALSAADTALRRAFGSPFDLWVRAPQWTCWPTGRLVADADGVEDLQLIDLLDAVWAKGSAPWAMAQAEGRHLLAIPFPEFEDHPLVAVALLDLPRSSSSAAGRHVYARVFQFAEAGREPAERLTDCTRQISEDLEQLTYLQSLARQLELCDISQPPSEVVQAVVPLLRELIHAEALIFIAGPH